MKTEMNGSFTKQTKKKIAHTTNTLNTFESFVFFNSNRFVVEIIEKKI